MTVAAEGLPLAQAMLLTEQERALEPFSWRWSRVDLATVAVDEEQQVILVGIRLRRRRWSPEKLQISAATSTTRTSGCLTAHAVTNTVSGRPKT